MDEQDPRVEFRTSERTRLVDSRSVSGRLKPVFRGLLTGSAKEEAYVARMVRRDRELNWG